MVDIIGGDRPMPPNGDGGRLGAALTEVRPRLYVLTFQVLERFAGIELISAPKRKLFGGREHSVRLTPVSKNGDYVLTELIGKSEQSHGERLPATLQQLPEGESFEGSVTVGRSRYLMMFPTIRITVGLDFKIVASPDRVTEYLLRATSACNDPERIMGELYRLE